MKPTALSERKKRGSFPEKGLEIFAAREGISIDWLRSGEGPVRLPRPHIEEGQIKDYYRAPLIEGKIAAGPGRTLSETEISSYILLSTAQVRERQLHDLIAVQVDPATGDSMAPTICPGDIVIIDLDDPGTDKAAFRNGGIYAVRDGKGGTAIKRVYRASKSLLIGSDNPKVAPEAAWTSDLFDLLIGRVVWQWKNLQEA